MRTSPQVELIVGPTGIGKTAHATALARRLGAPVVVLDRIQSYPALAIGSGRPSRSEWAGTQRYYLAERRVRDGDFPARQAFDAFRERLSAVRDAGHPRVVVEGGSISLLRRWAAAGPVDPPRLTRLTIDDHAGHRARVHRRVGRMLAEGMLEELEIAWRQGTAARDFVSGVVGYDAVVRAAAALGVPPPALARDARGDDTLRSRLATAITAAHVDYAHRQQRAFAPLGQVPFSRAA